MSITETTNYKILLKTANGEALYNLRFNMLPTADLIAEALRRVKASMPEAKSEAEAEVYKQERQRIDHLIQLVKLAEIMVPKREQQACTNVTVAGVPVGCILINTSKAWTTA